MAVYVAAGSWDRAANTCRILKAVEKDGYTRYIIEVNVPPYKWRVNHRYKEFAELHQEIVKHYSLDKNLLPPKKVFGNRSESFIQERQKALEFYLQTVIHQFSLLPEQLAKFLDFHKYEIRGITAVLAETFFSQGDIIIHKTKEYKFSSMQLYAIDERLKLTEPTCYSNNPKQDIAHLVEFITQLQHLKVVGSNEFYEDSNIIPNSFSFNLSLFKNLEKLEITEYNFEDNMICVDSLRNRLKSLMIHKSLKELSTFLLCGILHWSLDIAMENWPVWECVTFANLSNNFLKRIDPSIRLMLAVRHLDLSYNEIEVIENLEALPELSHLDLSHNKIENLESLHTHLGNIHSLHLSSNKIKGLQGLSKLFSVAKLYLDDNSIPLLNEISHLSKLPCIEVLNLQNNPVTLIVDYRSQALLMFGSRASEVELDGLKATEKEIDTVSVLQALKQARGAYKLSPTLETEDVRAQNEVKSNKSKPNTSLNVAVSGHKPSRQTLNNSGETSKFRQHIETLRQIGGTDWLHLLNEMHSNTEETSKYIGEKNLQNKQESLDIQLHTVPVFNKDFSNLTPYHFKTLSVSSEISYPEWISLLDNTNESFKTQLTSSLVKHGAYIERKIENMKLIHGTYADLMPEAKIIWMVLLESHESSVFELPVCAVLLKSEIVFLKVVSFSKSISSDSTSLPDLSYLRCVLSSDILSITLGPCHAYIEAKIKNESGSETLTFLFNNVDISDLFIDYCKSLYNISTTYKVHPFANNTLMFESIHTRLPLSKISFQNSILFSKRVLVSKVLHKCHYGILHYVFVTPSHVVLVEERLHIPQVVGLDTTVQPQFHICALVSVYTNIKQIHLKDIDDDKDNCIPIDSQSEVKQDALIENKHLEMLYRCGSWLLIEFESNVILYLNFFSLKQRNAFLDAYLCARSQR